MKKLTSLILTAAMMISSAGISVQAAGRVTAIDEALADASQIHILYNDTIVEYEDVKPVNTEGRVMIPFRAVLEDMGATVEYDDSQRLVTASKGTTEIKFTLMDDTIYINDNGAESTITMDVPMIIVEGRTLVPIRFMSNALGMQVGWDGDTETVIIMDYEDYFSNINAIMPNLTKLTQMQTPDFNKEYVTVDMLLAASDGTKDVNFTLSGDMEGLYADEAAQVGAGIDLSFNGAEFNDLELEIVSRNESVYVKTNLFGKLAEIIEAADAKAALSAFKDNTWYKIDLKALFEAIELPEEMIVAFEAAIESMNSGENVTLEDVLMNMVTTEGDVKFEDSITVATILDMLEAMDKYITVEEKANGGFSFAMNISTSQFLDIIVEFAGIEINDSDKKMLETVFQFDVSATSECDGNNLESNAKIVMNFDYDATKVNFTLEITDKAEVDSNAKVEEIKDSEDITNMLIEALK